MEHDVCYKTVLIVEDDPDVRASIAEVLEDNEYRPLSASNGRDALNALSSASPKPCLILLDIMMPIVDGRQFRSAQMEDPLLRSIPVVLLTAYAKPEQVALDMGVDSYLRKPCELEALLSTVAHYCRSDVSA